jgi:hypothetical protein
LNHIFGAEDVYVEEWDVEEGDGVLMLYKINIIREIIILVNLPRTSHLAPCTSHLAPCTSHLAPCTSHLAHFIILKINKILY